MVGKLMMIGLLGALLTTTTFAFAENVYVTANGSKYHKASCRLIRNNEKAKEMSKEEAMKSGHEPCKQCYKEDLPSDANQKGNNTNQTPGKKK